MYFVDREKIEEILQYMEVHLKTLEEKNTWETKFEILALERIAHTVIESILDVGNAMIDGFIMRDPGSYEDIIDIMLDEKVITEEMSKDLKDLVALRKPLVQEYTEVKIKEVLQVLASSKESVEQFPKHVRDYLTNELGPVSAFRN